MYYLSALSSFSLNDNAKIRWFYLAMMPNKTCHEKWCQMMRNDAFCLHHFAKPTWISLALMNSFLKSPRPSFIDKAGCTRQFESELSLRSFAQLFPINEFFSKTHQSSLTLKGGSTSHLGLLPSGKKRKPLLLVARNHFILWLADHQRSSPAAELRFFVRG